MRKLHSIWMLGVVVLLAIALAGCNGDETTSVAETESAQIEEAEANSLESDVATETSAVDAAEVEVALVPEIDGDVAAGEYAHELSLGGMRVHWSNDDDRLRMALVAPGTGYVSAGFDPTDRKVGANFVIGYVADGETVVRDHYGTRGNLHEADTDLGGTDDLLAFAGTEAGGETTIEFVIPLDSGDSYDRPLQPGQTYVLLVSYQDSRDDFISWHSRHGIGEITLDP